MLGNVIKFCSCVIAFEAICCIMSCSMVRGKCVLAINNVMLSCFIFPFWFAIINIFRFLYRVFEAIDISRLLRVLWQKKVVRNHLCEGSEFPLSSLDVEFKMCLVPVLLFRNCHYQVLQRGIDFVTIIFVEFVCLMFTLFACNPLCVLFLLFFIVECYCVTNGLVTINRREVFALSLYLSG